MEKVLLTVDGSWYTYVNGTGLVSKVNFDGSSVQNTFDELNRTEARKYTFGSNKSVFETMDYNRAGNRTDGKVMSHSFGGSYEFNYEYDQNGNITRISDDSGNLRNEYTYDELGRLTSEINIPNGSQSSKAVVGEKIEYLYSKDGNIYQRNFYKVQALQGKAYVDAKANRSDSFGYSNTEWSDQLSSARINGKGFNFTYDKIGNPLSYRDGMVMTWQNGRQLKSIKVDDTTTLEFTYDINGQRQSKVEKKNGTAVHTTKYYYDGTKLVGENKDGTIVWYDYDENGTPVGMRLSGDDYVFRRNLQGDITGIFDSTGTLVVEYTYGNSWGFGITVSGSKAAEIGACNSLRYRGYYYDSESGLYYVSSRYYDPEIGRWINADNQIAGVGGEVLGYNMFAYCMNNPVNMSDPSGNWPKWATKLVAAVAVVAVVAVVAAVTVATAGAGTAIAAVAVGAAKGAAIGFAVGAATGAAGGAISHRISTGSWDGAGETALNGMANGALSGAVSGAITGGITGGLSYNSGATSAGKGFDTYRQLKNEIGSPGAGNEWHHIVEQCQISKSGFSPQMIQNTNNIMSISKTTHRAISGYYSSVQPFTNGMIVRNWLAGQSFNAQYEFGINVIKMFM